jgi:hypothetical protein
MFPIIRFLEIVTFRQMRVQTGGFGEADGCILAALFLEIE